MPSQALEIPVGIALGRELGLPVPDLGLSACWSDRLFFHTKQNGPAALLVITDFLRRQRPLWSFLDFLVERWGLSGLGELPRELLRRVRNASPSSPARPYRPI